jgi:hypothetical protein
MTTTQGSAQQQSEGGGGAPPSGGNKSRAGARNLLTVSLSRFFSQAENMRAVLPYMTGDSEISLRLIDWFVTNFSKKHNVILSHELGRGNLVHFNVYLNYRSQLKAYSKQQFDPFRRRDRIVFFWARDSSVETTIGQLNFFRWMLQNRVIDYVAQNAAVIERDMMACQRIAASEKDGGGGGGGVGDDKIDDDACSSTSSDDNAGAGDARGGGKKDAASRRKRCELSQCTATRIMTRVAGAHTVVFE